PVAIMKSVSLGGSIVKRASLYNFDEVKFLCINKGSKVLIKKAAEIIPKVIKAENADIIMSIGDGGFENYFPTPTHCPSCNTPLIKPKGEVNLYCPNQLGCPAQLKARFEYFISKDAMNIDGVGPAIIEQLLSKDMIKNPADLYTLSKDDFLKLDLVKEKSAANIFNAIQESKSRPLNKFLTAIGIRFVGKETADILSQNFTSIDELQNASKEDLAKLDGIGEKIASSIENFFKEEKNLSILAKFKEVGINPTEVKAEKASQTFGGKTFVVTGTLSSMGRSEAQDEIKSHSGKVTSSVTKNTDFLVVGENPGSKYQKALDLGVIILDENQFLEVLHHPEKIATYTRGT
ncbi:MAG: helix-hairpin-helix domain-containing protein, partial [bacterium]